MDAAFDFSEDQIKTLRAAFKTLYRSRLNISQALETLKAGEPDEHVRHLIAFVEGSTRGIVTGRMLRSSSRDDSEGE